MCFCDELLRQGHLSLLLTIDARERLHHVLTEFRKSYWLALGVEILSEDFPVAMLHNLVAQSTPVMSRCDALAQFHKFPLFQDTIAVQIMETEQFLKALLQRDHARHALGHDMTRRNLNRRAETEVSGSRSGS